MGGVRRDTDGHVSKFIAFRDWMGWLAARRVGVFDVWTDVFGTRQEYNVREDIEVTSRDQDLS
jgi:hypothetical protein